MKDDLGDRMKAYESVNDFRLDITKPIYARIDGRGFSRFTKGMRRPFDLGMCNAMIKTTKGLVEKTHATVGYTQSDEISLVWIPRENENSSNFFDGRFQKIVSVLGSLSTVLFNQAINEDPYMQKYADRLPHFDCRVVSLPSKTEAANMILWRELDATRNAISMAARAYFSHKDLQGVSTKGMLEMLDLHGIPFNEYPEFFKRGTYIRRVLEARTLTEEERNKINPEFRPSADEKFMRSKIASLVIPRLLDIPNREEVLFG